MSLTPIAELVCEILDLTTASLHRHEELSAGGFDAIPEHFIQCYVFDHMRRKLYRTLETSIGDLWRYYCDHVRRHDGQKVDPDLVPVSLVSRGKPDLVIYGDDAENPDEQAPRILVEFKCLGVSSEDIRRIQAIMDSMPVFELGVSVGFYRDTEPSGLRRIAEADMTRHGMTTGWACQIGKATGFRDDPYIYAPVAFLRAAS